MKTTDDLRISTLRELTTPESLIQEYPVSQAAATLIESTRKSIADILSGHDDRLLVVVGPCSIHDPVAAIDYAKRLLPLKEAYSSTLLIVMRVYFEKPRTTVGWKGLINDPDLDGSFNIDKGLRTARKLLSDLNDLGIPAGSEFLDLISPQSTADFISWGAIGARTTESQSHRELASGLSCPVGFKNATNGDVQVAIDAIQSASRPHSFLSVTKQGKSAIFTTTGNEDCHVILRGGQSPNYDMFSVEDVSELLRKNSLRQKIMIDASHANSRKIPARQRDVVDDIARQVATGNNNLFGIMIESNLVEGRQSVVSKEELIYGQSITDPCISFDDTAPLLAKLSKSVENRKNIKK